MRWFPSADSEPVESGVSTLHRLGQLFCPLNRLLTEIGLNGGKLQKQEELLVVMGGFAFTIGAMYWISSRSFCEEGDRL